MSKTWDRSDFLEYQHRTVDWEKNKSSSAAWVFMGGGKTVSTLTAFSDLRESKDAKRMLVIAPLRVARDVWHAEVRKWAHLRHLTVARAVGNAAQRQAALESDANVVTVGRDNTDWLRRYFILMPDEDHPHRRPKQVRPWPFDMVVLDESSSFKAQSSQRFKAVKMLRKLFPRFVELTGTPAPNRLPDLWSQMYLVDQGQRLGRTETAYRERWFTPPKEHGFRWEAKRHAAAEIHSAVADVVLSLNQSDYMDLPPVTHNPVWLTLPQAAMNKYREFERKAVVDLDTGERLTAISAGVLHGKKCQFANGFAYPKVGDSSFVTIHDDKLDALDELVDAASGPIMVAYSFKADLARIKERLSKRKGIVVDLLSSEESKDRWNAGAIDVLLLHPDSAGHGLNLHGNGCEHLIWFGLTANLEHVQQVNARLSGGHRLSGHLVISYILAGSTVDEDSWQALKEKAGIQDGLRRGVADNAEWLWA